MQITGRLLRDVKSYARAHEKKERYRHSLRVAKMCRKMCRIYGLDEKKGYFAGLAHDICKDFEDGAMLEICTKDGLGPLCAEEIKKPALLHGRAARYVLLNEFDVTDEQILEAVCVHTLGGKGVSKLSMILFSADKIEPGRPQSTKTYRKNLCSMPVEKMTLSVLEENFTFLKNKGKTPALISLEFADELRKSIREEK